MYFFIEWKRNLNGEGNQTMYVSKEYKKWNMKVGRYMKIRANLVLQKIFLLELSKNFSSKSVAKFL